MKNTFFSKMKTTVWMAAVIVGVSFGTPRAQAMFTDHFHLLLTELQTRSLALSNSTDVIEKKQKKAADLAIKKLNRSTKSLATDIKAAGAVSKSLARAFPDDFPTAPLGGAGFSFTLDALLFIGFDGLQEDVEQEISKLEALMASLPDGKPKAKAFAAYAVAINKLATITAATSFADWAKALTATLTKTLAGQKTAIKAGGTTGGGGGGVGMSADIVVDGGSTDHWVADTTYTEWVQGASLLTVEGDRTASPSYHLTVPILSGFSGATGTYGLASGAGGVSFGLDYYAVSSGSITVSTFNAAAQTLSGTFSFTATNDVSTITVSSGVFNLNTLIVTP